MTRKETEHDAFWDIEKLVPKRSGRPLPFADSPVLTEVVVPAAAPDPTAAERRITVKAPVREEEVQVYRPERQRLITSVTVRRPSVSYDFYDRFRKAALLYYDVHGTEAPFVPFYSYMPQYEHMRREQKEYYFFWRDEVRAGRYPRTDYAYIYLYVYEILNLPEKYPPEVGVRQLILLWRSYREQLRGLERYLSVWIQDYCLVYRVTPPMELLADCLSELVAGTTFKEFYLYDFDVFTPEGLSSLLLYFSDYDYRSGRYYTEQSREPFDRHMRAAVAPIVTSVLEAGTLDEVPTTRLVREAFPNSLLTHSVKCTLEVEYHPLTRLPSIREQVSASVRYAENRLRALLGVKSRLSVKGLPDEARARIDRYFDRELERERRELERRNRPAYETKYEAVPEALSLTGADIIERASWDTTLRLVPDEERCELVAEGVPARQDTAVASVTEQTARAAGEATELPTAALSVLRGALSGEVAYTASLGLRATVEQINEYFSDLWGDIVLEESERGFVLIEDYREDVKEWLSNRER